LGLRLKLRLRLRLRIKNLMKKILLTILFGMLAISCTAKTFVYNKTVGKERSKIAWQETKPNSLTIEIVLDNSSKNEYHKIFCSNTYNINSFLFLNKNNGTEVLFKKQDGCIQATGLLRHKKFLKLYKTKNIPWYQCHELALAWFVRLGDPEIAFFSIRPDNCELYEFIARRDGEEQIKIGSKEIKVVRIKTSLTGMFANMWTGYYWFRKSDGVCVKYKAVEGFPGTPETVEELTEIADK